jgi:hypothetical protein
MLTDRAVQDWFGIAADAARAQGVRDVEMCEMDPKN